MSRNESQVMGPLALRLRRTCFSLTTNVIQRSEATKNLSNTTKPMLDVSIIIVHYNTPRLLRQTLKGIRRANLHVSYEVIVVENDVKRGCVETVRREFPEVQLVVNEKNLGFGVGMNTGFARATGRYLLVFNPDIILSEGSLEKLVAFMDARTDVGMVGPRLNNPDGSLQASCYRFMEPKTVLYRRIPLLRSLPFAKRHLGAYLMNEWDHAEARDVDYLLGAAMLVRRKALDMVGGFDPAYFVYFEDQDFCRRFWKAGWRVIYNPEATMIHYHRRETAEGHFFRQLFKPLTRIQLRSAVYYFKKYRGEKNPHTCLTQPTSFTK